MTRGQVIQARELRRAGVELVAIAREQSVPLAALLHCLGLMTDLETVARDAAEAAGLTRIVHVPDMAAGQEARRGKRCERGAPALISHSESYHGKVCAACGGLERYVSSGRCVVCQRAAVKRSQLKNGRSRFGRGRPRADEIRPPAPPQEAREVTFVRLGFAAMDAGARQRALSVQLAAHDPLRRTMALLPPME